MPRTYLFTSGRANRCNPKNVRAVYFSENKETADAEWEELNDDPDQPVLTFHGRLRAANIIDLSSTATFNALGLSQEDLTGNFRFKSLNIQQLGKAVSAQTDAVAIRYPSRAMGKIGKTGFNLAIFPDAIRDPDTFVIYGDKRTIIEQWPSPRNCRIKK